MFCIGTFQKNKGSITVEAALIVPVVILSVVALIFIGLILYQRSILQAEVDKATEAGALYWGNRKADLSTGKILKDELESPGLYWRIHDTEKNDKIAKIEAYTKELIKKHNFLNPTDSVIKTEIIDYIVYKRLEITVQNCYRIPAGSFLHVFGVDDRFSLKVESCSVIKDTAEFIRNTDFIIDIEKGLENKYPGLKDLGDQTRKIINQIKSNIEALTK